LKQNVISQGISNESIEKIGNIEINLDDPKENLAKIS
jgi:hypothetical protein